MMKYRLKKWYPSLPKDWEVGMWVGYGDRGINLSPCNGKYRDFYISPSEAHDNHEFWEKVEEKSFEVLSYKYELVCSDNGHYKDFLISSVRRLSDNEIFSLGDSIHRNGKIVTLEKIELDEGWAGGVKVNDGVKPQGGECLKTLKKAKQSLFQTNDGVDIYVGGTFYYVNDAWAIYDYTVNCDSSFIPYVNKTSFSTKEKADEWILWNKRDISLNDVYQTMLSSSYTNILDNLKEIVKSRL